MGEGGGKKKVRLGDRGDRKRETEKQRKQNNDGEFFWKVNFYVTFSAVE